MPASLPGGMAGDTYVSNVRRGLELIAGHFDSAWIADHL